MSRFNYVKYDEQSIQAQNELKTQFENLEAAVNCLLPDGRAKSLVLTNLEEAYMWCGKGIRDAQIKRNGSAEEQPERKNG